MGPLGSHPGVYPTAPWGAQAGGPGDWQSLPPHPTDCGRPAVGETLRYLIAQAVVCLDKPSWLTPSRTSGPDPGATTCMICRRTFASLAGRRVHERHVQGTTYHLEEVERLEQRPKDRWDLKELSLLAGYESDHLGASAIDQRIQREVLPHRTIEAIKGKRRQKSNRRLLKERPSGGLQHHLPFQPPVVGDQSTGDRPPSSAKSAAVILESPPTPGDPGPGDVKRELVRLSGGLGINVPQSIKDLRKKLDDWSPLRPARPRRDAWPAPPRPPGQRVSRQRKRERRLNYARFQQKAPSSGRRYQRAGPKKLLQVLGVKGGDRLGGRSFLPTCAVYRKAGAPFNALRPSRNRSCRTWSISSFHRCCTPYYTRKQTKAY